MKKNAPDIRTPLLGFSVVILFVVCFLVLLAALTCVVRVLLG